MATRSDLRTRLQRRLGLGVVSAVEEDRLNEALNSGLSRAEADNIPGLNRWEMTGAVLGQLDLTDVTLTQHSATAVRLSRPQPAPAPGCPPDPTHPA